MAQPGEIIALRLSRYQLGHKLASSTYGEIWHARRLDAPAGSDSEVALKLVHTARMAEVPVELHQHWLLSAHKEILFLRSLSPWDERHIVRLIDDGMHENLPVLALELMAGDLASYLKHHPRIRFSHALHWLAQINQALAKVHQYGWRYLDLKPANLLLGADVSRLKLADFGTTHRLPQTRHSYRGTANWQAPEQFFPVADNAQEPLYQTSTRTDYFALGALFYYLVSDGLPLRFCSLCGQSFHSHQVAGALRLQQAMPQTLYPDEAQLFMQMIEQDQAHDQDQSATPGTLAQASLALLQSLLAANPAQRPPHALAIARQIDGLLAKAERQEQAELVMA